MLQAAVNRPSASAYIRQVINEHLPAAKEITDPHLARALAEGYNARADGMTIEQRVAEAGWITRRLLGLPEIARLHPADKRHLRRNMLTRPERVHAAVCAAAADTAADDPVAELFMQPFHHWPQPQLAALADAPPAWTIILALNASQLKVGLTGEQEQQLRERLVWLCDDNVWARQAARLASAYAACQSDRVDGDIDKTQAQIEADEQQLDQAALAAAGHPQQPAGSDTSQVVECAGTFAARVRLSSTGDARSWPRAA